MAKKTGRSHEILTEINGLSLKGRYKRIKKGVYKLNMELPFRFERLYKEDILELDEMVEWIMIQEMVEILDDYNDIKENTPIFNKILSEYDELIIDGKLTDSDKQITISKLYDKYIPEEKQPLHRLKTQYSPSEIKYFLSISL